MAIKSDSRIHTQAYPIWLSLLLVVSLLVIGATEAGAERPIPGIVNVSKVAPPVVVSGEQKILVVAVRFPGVNPGFSLQKLEGKIDKVGRYIRHNASYRQTWLTPTLVGWYEMPGELESYAVSPHNYEVEKKRVRRLLKHALSAARRDVKLESFNYIWVLVGVHTTPGTGYGMIAYAANPGMLSGVRGEVHMEPIPLAGGDVYQGPVIVSAENAHVGHVAHDLLHALGGVQEGRRAVVDLYDFYLQSNPPTGQTMSPALFAIHAGPWDIMSQHFIAWDRPPPPPSSFTRLQLSWIGKDQAVTIMPGETRIVTLAPLARGQGLLSVRIPLDQYRSILLENRQPVGGDEVLPASGLLVLEVDTSIEEGAGIVKVVNANPIPRIPGLNSAPFVPDLGQLRYYENPDARVAVAPLAFAGNGSLRVVVTVPERIQDFLSR